MRGRILWFPFLALVATALTPPVVTAQNLGVELFFDGSAAHPDLFPPSDFPPSFGEPVIDGQGRLIVVSSYASLTCGFNFCGMRLNSVSPTGVLNWQTPRGDGTAGPTSPYISSDIRASKALVPGPGDRIYLQGGRTTLYAFSADGNLVEGWPTTIIPVGDPFPNSSFSRDSIVDPTDGTVYAGTRLGFSFGTFPSALVAWNPDGSQKWRKDFPDGAVNFVQGPARDIYVVKSAGRFDAARFFALDHGSGTELCQGTPVGGDLVGGLEGVFVSFRTDVMAFDANCVSQRIYSSPDRDLQLRMFVDAKILAMEFPNSPPFDANQVRLIALSTDGTLLWRNQVVLPEQPNPMRVQNGVVYALGQDMTDANKRKLFLLDADTGNVLTSVEVSPLCREGFCGVGVGEDGSIYISDLDSTKIYKISAISPPTIPAPSLLSVEPSSGIQGQTISSVVVAGSNFDANATLSFSGSGITIKSYSSRTATQIVASITVAGNALPGPRNATVTNPDSQQGMLLGAFTVLLAPPPPPSPSIRTVSPARGFQNQTIASFAVDGENFSAAAVLTFSGNPADITVSGYSLRSPTRIVATIVISNNATIGARDVTITNPDSSVALLKGAFEIARPPVILVHGWCSDPAAFGQMGRLLGEEGLTVAEPSDYAVLTRVPALGGPGVSIEELATVFAGDVLKVLKEAEAPQVDVVAHSMGGLIARAWMAGLTSINVPYEGQIRRLVLVGTPNYGAERANLARLGLAITSFFKEAFGIGVECSETQATAMRFGSKFIWDLHDRWTEFRASSPYDLATDNLLFIAGTQDDRRGLFECNDIFGCDDGVVNIASAVLPGTPNGMVRYVPYKHSATAIIRPIFQPAINTVEDKRHKTFRLVRTFLKEGTVLPQCCGKSTVNYNPPHLRGNAKHQGLLFVRLVDATSQQPLAGRTSRLAFEPRVLTDQESNTAASVTAWGVAKGTYKVTITSRGYLKGKLNRVRIVAARPTVPGPLPLRSGR